MISWETINVYIRRIRAAKIIFGPQGKRKLNNLNNSISMHNSPNNDTQIKSTTVCHKQGISTTKIN